MLAQFRTADVLDERSSQRERPAGHEPFGVPFGHDPVQQRLVVPLDVAGVDRGTEDCDTPHRWNAPGRCDDGGPSERVAHQDVDRMTVVTHELGRPYGVVDLRGERAVTPVSA